MDDPATIYQRHLDEVSALLWERDLDGVCALLAMPNSIALVEGTVRFDDRASLAQHLSDYRDTLDGMGATGYLRLCIEAGLRAPGRIQGRHQSYVLRGAARLQEPYVSEMSLTLTQGEWLGHDVVIHASNDDVRAVDPTDLGDGPS